MKRAWMAAGVLVLVMSHAAPVFSEPEDPVLNAQENAYLNRQAQALLGEAAAALDRCPPQHPEPRERRTALLLIDAVLHDKHAARRVPVREFFHGRAEKALAALENTRVEKGAVIWKLYNMGFIVRTASVTLAFDLVRGNSAKEADFALPDAVMDRFADQCDALFISHRHDDHADMRTAQAFLDRGKPVAAPPGLWEESPIGARVLRMKREARTLQSLSVRGGAVDLRVVVWPGHQMKPTENNVSLVFTPEGMSFCHMGDQINEGDFMEDYAWIDEAARHHKVDVLMPACWTNEIHRIVRGFNPRLVLPGHENELGHPLDDRVPYWGDSEYLGLTYPELLRSDYPVVVMAWGESFHYSPPEK